MVFRIRIEGSGFRALGFKIAVQEFGLRIWVRVRNAYEIQGLGLTGSTEVPGFMGFRV